MHIPPFNPLMLVSAAVMGCISAFLAYKRDRSPYLWFALGFLFGIFGIFAIFFFTTKKKQQLPNLPTKEPMLIIEGPTDKFWYYLDLTHKQKGPMSHQALTKAFKEGVVGPSTYIWNEEMPEWKLLKDALKTEHSSPT
ncbi:MAG: hypothetical protein ACD_16C00199G0003 [uncultured bacterium]|nr:MAG: hypothetical protein ACD_16C00199G0003 [uncultured bacterium]OGN55227.1 MAG: hypothetical protein A2796_01485 [Chlamydiae bacterium RIFCSPHIGHO2_01_FULL_44_39]OGN58505.1 MAG: hypothetical protein A3C42_05195 [Chlamydiae bacterium RIFCSPHIGHO2_02_FULL_45_9]OGN59723.1 MAG: hypothetical protein A3D96_03150 [Chlamydiae bacterium RIFCSPHIGHO2_12_FULL_44_59]OGN65806.1 MAG: hypothetical protein A2978_01210 [Chlamydiae bacterium RIFCSPLOWO2_01_FULL_44_52]OGN67983.1 MAG: hypothetical protein A3